MKLAQSVWFLAVALLGFVSSFMTFLLFQNNLVFKIVACFSSDVFAVLVAVQLAKKFKQDSQREDDTK